MRRSHSTWVKVGVGLIATVSILVVTVIGVLLTLRTERGRAFACSTILERVNGVIPGAIVVDTCATLELRKLRLEGVQILDPAGRVIADAVAIEAEPDLLGLLSGTIAIRSVRGTAPRLRLIDHGEELAIVAAFVSPTDEPNEPDDSGVEVVIGVIEVTDGAVTDLPDRFSIEGVALNTNLAVREDVTLDIAHIEGRLEQANAQVVDVVRGAGALSFGDASMVDVKLDLEAEGETARVAANFEGTAERFTLEALVEALGGRVTLSSRNRAGRAEAKLDVSSLDLGRLTWAEHGALEADLRASARFSGPEPSLDSILDTTLEGKARVVSLELSELKAQELDFDVDLEGRPPTPDGSVVVRAAGVELAGTPVESLRLAVTGDEGRYSAKGRAPLPNGWIVGIDLGARVAWPVIHLDGEASLARSPWSPARATLSEVAFEVGDQVSIGALDVEGEGVRLEARGHYGFDDTSDVSLDLRTLDLPRVSRALDADIGLTGTLRGTGTLSGTRSNPQLSTTLSLEDGSFESVPIESLEALLTYRGTSSAQADVDLDLGDRGSANLRAEAALARSTSLPDAFRGAKYDARLLVDSFALETLSALIDGMPVLEGAVTGEATVQGRVKALEVELDAVGRGVASPYFTKTDLRVAASLRRNALDSTLDATTTAGGALQARAEARVNLRQLLRGASLSTVADEPWKLSVRIPEQPWKALPIDVELPTPARVSLELDASGGKSPLVADVDIDLRIPRASSTRAEALDELPVCPDSGPARLRSRLRLRQGESQLDIEGYVAHERVLVGEARMQTRIVEWVSKGFPPRWPAANAKLNIEPIEIRSVPVACTVASGRLRSEIVADDLFQPSQRIAVQLDVDDLAVANETPVDLALEARASATEATTNARLSDDQQELAELVAHIPLDVESPGAPIAVGAGELSVSADFDDAPLSVLLAPVPWVERPSGGLSGNLRAAGDPRDLENLEVRGSLQLAKASMTLTDPFVRLDEVDADLGLEADRLVVRSFSAQDREGRVDVEGSIGLRGWKPGEVDFSLRADQYPLRNAGVLMATLNGRATLAGDLAATPRSLRLVLGRELSLVLPEDLQYGGVQDLAQHPAVIYPGQPGFDRSLSVQQALGRHREGDPKEEYGPPLVVYVRSSEPFWVRRADFSLQLGVDVEVHSERDRTWLIGTIDVRRGFLALLSKNFDIESGSIRFTGATPVDPTVDLRASHRLRSGYSVAVEVTGPVSDPELTFSSDDPDATTDSEIIALLLGTSRQGAADEEANDQTRSVLAGLTAGLVGSIARRELGQYAPIIAVESEGTLETTGIRAGFTVGDLVPEAWQAVLLGVYVEGMLAGSQQGPKGGLLLELLFPHHLSTTTTYEQPDNWSLDLLWEP